MPGINQAGTEQEGIRQATRWGTQAAHFATDFAWVFWFGGLTFYMAVVVPIGGDIIGSDVQGEITSVVTGHLNWASITAASLMLVRGWTQESKLVLWSAMSILLTTILLIWLRDQLLDRMDGAPLVTAANDQWLSDWSFYSIHRIYLWTTTIQWLFGLMPLVYSRTKP